METTTISHLHPAGSRRLEDHPRPDKKVEVWRYAPIERINQLLDAGIDPLAPVAVTIGAPDGVEAHLLASGQAPRDTVLLPTDKVAALAATAESATYLKIPAGCQLADPIRVDVQLSGDSLAGRPIVIEAGDGSQATVLVQHRGHGAFLGNIEILVGEAAQLTVVSLQDWDATAQHLGQHEARIGRDAHYRHIAVSLGGDLIRLQHNVSYAAPGGKAELFGVYFVDAGQHIEHRLFVDHNQPHCQSLVDYRGALQGKAAHSVWVGDVLIRPAAQGIETYESNKNLVLSEGCRADAVPNLEIETGEIVGAGHSASTGRFDDEQLFYLRSRGLSEAEARQLVVRGFFAHLINRIGIADVEQALMAKIDRELDSAQDRHPNA